MCTRNTYRGRQMIKNTFPVKAPVRIYEILGLQEGPVRLLPLEQHATAASHL
jgi:hypothetical protein